MSVEEYVRGILNYHFSLDRLNYIKAPFFKEKRIKIVKNVKNKKNKKNKIHLENRIDIKLIAILGKKAYIKIDEYLGNAIIDENKRWVKIGDKISKCRVIKITDTDLYIKCNNRLIHKTLNTKIPLRD